jgi:hypothetical protein
MSSSSSSANADERITETTAMTDVNTEISSDTTTEKWLIPSVVLLVIVLLFYKVIFIRLLRFRKTVYELYKRYTSRGDSNDTTNEHEIATSNCFVGQDQDNAGERNSNEETRSAEEQPLTAYVDISPHLDAVNVDGR